MTTDTKQFQTNISHCLQAFCSDEEDGMRAQFHGIHNSVSHLVATNAHILAEVSLDEYPGLSHLGSDRTPLGFPSDWKNLIPKPVPSESYGISDTYKLYTPKDRFQNFEQKEPDECGSCNGTGVRDHWCDCDFCELDEEDCWNCGGKGVINEPPPPPTQCIKINGRAFNAEYVNIILELIHELTKGANAFIYLRENKNKSALFQDDGLRCIIMPLIDEQTRQESDRHGELITLKTVKL